jgi:hypothetical protein
MRHVGIDIAEKQDDTETEDIYDNEERDHMLDEDEITAAENAFIQRREMKPEKREGKKITHDDTVFGELAEDEYS